MVGIFKLGVLTTFHRLLDLSCFCEGSGAKDAYFGLKEGDIDNTFLWMNPPKTLPKDPFTKVNFRKDYYSKIKISQFLVLTASSEKITFPEAVKKKIHRKLI